MIIRDILFSLNSTVPAPLDLLVEDIYPGKPKKEGDRLVFTVIGQLKKMGWQILNPGRLGYILSQTHADLLRKAFTGKIKVPVKEIGKFTPENVQKAVRVLLDD